MEHWSNEFEHESLSTPEAKEAFSSAMGKYETQEEAIVGGFNAMKATGKPYKLPESLDKLPDDKTRAEFHAGVAKLLGAVTTEHDLKDVNFSDGLAEGTNANDKIVAAFKQFAIEKKLPKSVVTELTGFNNKVLVPLSTQIAQEIVESQKQQRTKETNDALIKHPSLGSKEAVGEASELVRRMFKNHAGLTPEEYEEVGEALVSAGITQNATMARAVMKLAEGYKEGSTEQGDGGPKPSGGYDLEKETKEQSPKTAAALGW